jgi:hypothetical protein
MIGIIVFTLTSHLTTEDHLISSSIFLKNARITILIMEQVVKKIASFLIPPSKDFIILISIKPILANRMAKRERPVSKVNFVLLFTKK